MVTGLGYEPFFLIDVQILNFYFLTTRMTINILCSFQDTKNCFWCQMKFASTLVTFKVSLKFAEAAYGF